MPRFTASAPNPADVAGHFRKYRCTSVQACDRELRELVTRKQRTKHPELLEEILADCDAVLDKRTVLAVREATAEAKRLAREP